MKKVNIILAMLIAACTSFGQTEYFKERDQIGQYKEFMVITDASNRAVRVNAHFPMTWLVAVGAIDGYSVMQKYGINADVTVAGSPEDIWEFGGVYPHDTTNTAPIAYISSSSAADDNSVLVQGLDIDGYESSQYATLDGQNNVSLSTPLWRVFRMINDSADPIAGMVYCHTNATVTAGVPPDAAVRAIIDNGKNQTLMCVYTIPRGKVGLVTRGEVGVELEGNAAALAEFAHLHYEARAYGKSFTVKQAVTCVVGGNAVYQTDLSFPYVVPALTDIKLTTDSVSADMGVWGTFDVLLMDEDLVRSNKLSLIRQPGY